MSDQPPDATAPQQGIQPTPTPGWRDRVWSLPAVIAVALASVIVGGLGGAALASVSDDGSDGREGRFGPGQSRIHRDDNRRPPGMMNERQRERWREWRQEQRRQWPQDGRPSPTRPTPSR